MNNVDRGHVWRSDFSSTDPRTAHAPPTGFFAHGQERSEGAITLPDHTALGFFQGSQSWPTPAPEGQSAHNTWQQPPPAFGAAIASASYDMYAQHPYQRADNAIPGLGLGSANGHAQPTVSQDHLSAVHGSPTHPAPARQVYAPSGWNANSGHEGVVAPHNHAAGTMVEESEVSEQDPDDFYEPQEILGSVSGFSDRRGNQGTLDVDVAQGGLAAGFEARERSRSYSPYLSPQEAQSNHETNSLTLASGLAKGQIQASSNVPGSQSFYTQYPDQPHKPVEDAKLKARDAIVRLRTFNIRFQDYVDGGIDAGIMQDLFQELDLDMQASASVSKNQDDGKQRRPASQKPKEMDGSTVPPPTASQAALDSSKKVKDKSEERKDRIARLLAAKGTKSAAPASDAPAQTATAAAKKLAEKSELIRKKMEALQKSREAQKRLQDEPTTSGNESGVSGNASSSSAEKSNGQNLVDVSTASKKSNESLNATVSQTSYSLPGLPGPSASETTQSRTSQKRPSAAGLNAAFHHTFKRPFGQSRDSRPFLIDVSDDDDDAEMDLDSPNLQFSSVHPLAASANKTQLPEMPSVHDQSSRENVASPSRASESPGLKGSNIPLDSLASMEGEIREMKRKIAIAEFAARKNAKSSGSGSPMVSSAKSTPDATEASAAVPSANQEGLGTAIEALSPSMQSAAVAIESKPQDPHRRRSRSHAANERLTAIEARRKERLSQLELLNSQVADIEKELAEALKEEESLRNDDASSVSDLEDLPLGEAIGDDLAQLPDSVATPAPAQSIPAASEINTVVFDKVTSLSDCGPDVEAVPRDAASSQALPASNANNLGNDVSEGEDSMAVDGSLVALGEGDEAITQPITESASNVEERIQQPIVADQQDFSDSSSASFSPEPADTEMPLDLGNQDASAAIILSEVPKQISAGDDGSTLDVDADANLMDKSAINDESSSSFLPYQSALQYFRAYRFHPDYDKSVAGGLRSLTYSNSIDTKKPFCPDQLAGQACPRGSQCDFQHFENIQAADDQILLQLGGYSSHDESQSQEYISGLRKVLTDFHTRKIKDFATISKGIIDYRSQFYQDKSKILPLGNVSL